MAPPFGDTTPTADTRFLRRACVMREQRGCRLMSRPGAGAAACVRRVSNSSCRCVRDAQVARARRPARPLRPAPVSHMQYCSDMRPNHVCY